MPRTNRVLGHWPRRVALCVALTGTLSAVPALGSPGQPLRPPAAALESARGPRPSDVSPKPQPTARVLGVRASRARPSTEQGAPPPGLCVDTGSRWVEQRGAAALARMRFDWRALGYQVRFLPSKRGSLGATYPASERIDIYVRSCAAQSNDLLAVTVAHELGHAFDIRYGTRERHAAWLRLRGIPAGTTWYPNPPAPQDFSYGCGDFAEVFALWQVSGRYFASTLAAPPTDSQLEALIPLMRP